MSDKLKTELNVLGTCCPMPLIELAKAIRRCNFGQIIEVTGNDPIFEPSVRDFCRTNGHEILEVIHRGHGVATISIRVGGQS